VLEKQIPRAPPAALSPAERARAWRESARGLPDTKPLSDDTISRESLYTSRR